MKLTMSVEDPDFYFEKVTFSPRDAVHANKMYRKAVEHARKVIPCKAYSSQDMTQEQLRALVPSANGGAK